MDSCYKERCWTEFFNKRGNPSLFEAFQRGRFAEKSQWKSSPRKRAPPTPSFTATTVAKRKASEASEGLDSSTERSESISGDATSTKMADLAFPETVEMENNTGE